MNRRSDELRRQILNLVREYHDIAFPGESFAPDSGSVPVSGRVFDAEELVCLTDAALDFWLTSGRYADQFEREFSRFWGLRHASLCNSGSSANLLALSSLTSPKLGDRRLRTGDEVITVAAGFPTTVNPIFQTGLVPVFVDIDLGTYNVSPERLADAVGPETRAIFLAHTLGNPFDLDTVGELAARHDLLLIEDCCDAVGSRFGGQHVGTFGSLATVSFYPAHHLTMGEGGCVLTGSSELKRIVESYRDWGRDCWCDPGKENTCGRRFDWQLGELPAGYDHKYIYSHVGYNLKLTDMQAAVGVAQLRKLPAFIEKRKQTFDRLYRELQSLEEFFILPSWLEKAEPSWFGFPLTIRESAPFDRRAIIAHLTGRGIGTRALFGGNLTRQPAYMGLPYRVAGPLANSDAAMERSFWLGVYPGIDQAMAAHLIDSLKHFCARF